MPLLLGGREKIKELKKQMKKLKQQLEEIKTTPDEFNFYFSKYGWIAYDSISMEFMKNQIELAKIGESEKAIANFADYYDAERMRYELLWLNHTETTRKRIPLIEKAYLDYQENRYHATIPIILMMIDGVVNDVVGKGFHSDKEDIDAWNSITTIDNGLGVIHNVFRKGRFKTREDEIEEPYRNGILHGLDLGYANHKVALKCWHYLFVIRDWAQSKMTEEERHEKFIKDSAPPDMKEVFLKLHNNKIVKKTLSKWKAKEYSEQYYHQINSNQENIDKLLPEYVVVLFIKWLNKKNYKELSELFWEKRFYSKQTKISDIKQEFGGKVYRSLKFEKVINEAPAITEIYAEADGKKLNFRLIYQPNDDGVAVPSLGNGSWKIAGVQEV
ncbi:hypothetical protein SAMN06295888_10580 [Desulfonatronum zhilinae]|nr:hypothetical protein SAMN06295888_10580 [Desulfonatronum zhilinae]